MSSFDLKPLFKTAIGYDRLVNLMDDMTDGQSNYPPYDIERIDKGVYRIVIALAGFEERDLRVFLDRNVLTVSGAMESKAEQNQQDILYQGIARRKFERKFSLAPYIIVTDAVLEGGLLKIVLEEDVPESERAQDIPIR